MSSAPASTAAQRWVLALTATAALMVALDQLVVMTALPAIRRDLSGSLSTLEWTVSSFSLSFAVLLITGATLGDRFGRRRVFLAGIALFSLSSAGCALAPDLTTLIVARTLQGAGSALVAPLAVALLTTAFPPERRGPVVGVFAAITGLAVAGGPVVGGVVTQGIAWPWIFWLNVPIGAALIPLVRRHVPESFGPPRRFDPTGLLLVSAALFGVTWGLIRSDVAGWGSTEIVGALVAGGVLLVAFVAWELRVPNPMLPMGLFARRTYAAGSAASLTIGASLTGAVFLFSQYLQAARGYGPLAAGVRFLPWTATLFVVAPPAGVLIARIGSRPVLVLGLALQGAGLGWLAWDVSAGVSYPAMVLALVIAGSGTSLAIPAAQNAVMNAVGPEHLGQASGTFNSVRQLGSALGVAIASAVFAARGSFAGPHAITDGVAPALGVAAGIALLGAAFGLALEGRAVATSLPAPEPVTVAADAVV